VPVRVAFGGDDESLPSTVDSSATVEKRATVLAYTARPTWPTTFRPRCAGRWASRAAPPIGGRTVTFTMGTGPSAKSCTCVTDAAGLATCTIANVVQPPSAASVPIQLAFAGDDFYWSWTASASANLLFYTGRATGLSAKLLILPPAVVSDTGEVSTASRSTTRRAAVSWANGLLTATGISASVTTGGGTSSAKASTGQLTLRLAGLPVIRATDLQTTSQSSCQIGPFTADASGWVSIGSLSIGGVAPSVVTVGPNTVIRAGVLTITLNE
jgi:hypothetical protein